MVDTARTLAALQALLADNTSADISPQDVRDVLVSTFVETTIGDLAGIAADGIQAPLAAGADGEVLTADSGETLGLKWAAGGGGNHTLLSATHTDTLAAGVTDGSIVIGNVTPAWSELVIAIPAANVRNVLGIDNGEVRPSWKTALDGTNPADIAAAASPGTSLVFSHRDHVHDHPAALGADLHHTESHDYDTHAGGVPFGEVEYDDATSDPLIDADAAADGIEASAARKDHVHPKHHAKYTDAEAVAAAKAATGITDNDLVGVDGPGAGAPASGEYAKWTATGLEGKSAAEVAGDIQGSVSHDSIADVSADDHHTESHTVASHSDATEGVQDIAGALVANATGTHTGIAITYQDATGDMDFVVDHDTAANYDANDHIDHTTITLTAGVGLSGGGTIAANRTFTVDLNELTTEVTIAAGDFIAMVDITDSGSGKITFANLEATISHDGIAGVSPDDHHAASHTAASHSDQGATGAELETLTDGSDADALHAHSGASLNDDIFVLIAGDTMGGALVFPDNIAATFGTDSDATILHDNSNLVISCTTGDVDITAGNLNVTEHVAIGGESPDGDRILLLADTLTAAPSVAMSGCHFALTIDQTAHSIGARALTGQCTILAGNSANFSSTFNGGLISMLHNGDGILTGGGALKLTLKEQGSGSITNARGLEITSLTGNLGTVEVIRVRSQSAGTVRNTALVIDAVTGTIPKAMKIAGGNSYHVGKFNFGSTSDPSANADITLDGTGALCMLETTTPTADTNFGKVYPKNDNKLYFQDGAGTEHEVAFV